jgi:hypothetical protein
MASADVTARGAEWGLVRPWPWMITGVVASGAAFFWGRLFEGELPALLFLFVAVGLVGAITALCLRFHGGIEGPSRRLGPGAITALTVVNGLLALTATGLLLLKLAEGEGLAWGTGAVIFFWVLTAPWCAALAVQFGQHRDVGTVSARLEGAALLVLAALVAFLTCWALYWGPQRAGEWDSLRVFFAGAALAAFVASPLVAARQRLRRTLFSVLILVHFGGIATSVMSAPPGPWVAGQLGTRFYYPYLEFMYLTNAYRFYAPEPGAASQVWFRVEYRDQKTDEIVWHWLKLPEISDEGEPNYPLRLQYQRRLAMTENAAQVLAMRTPSPKDQEDRLTAKLPAPGGGLVPVPLHPDSKVAQFRFPQPATKQLIESFARHVLRRPHPSHPDARPLLVKIYRVHHLIPTPQQLGFGADPRHPTYYLPYYMGEYDPAGRMTTASERDPFLYWVLPIIQDRDDPSMLNAYVFLHAGRGRDRWKIPGGPKERLPRFP